MKDLLNKVTYFITLATTILIFYQGTTSNIKLYLTNVLLTFLIMIMVMFISKVTNNKVLKVITNIIYACMLILLLANKICISFFNSYISFERLGTAQDLTFVITSFIHDGLNYICIIFTLMLALNFITMLKLKFTTNFKWGIKTIIIIFAISFLATFWVGYFTNEVFATTLIKRNNTKTISDDYIIENYNDSEKNEYTNIAQGRNVFLIQCESLQNFVIDTNVEGHQITPFLNDLICQKDVLYFDNCYTQIGIGNTSDAEFVTLTSNYALKNESVYQDYPNFYESLVSVFNNQGYETNVFHGYKGSMWNRETMYDYLGWQNKYFQDDFDNSEIIGYGLADKSFFTQSINYIKQSNKPTFNFLITLSSHTPFEISDNMCEFKFSDKINNTKVGKYLQHMHLLDKALEHFITTLKENNLYNNSIIILYGDHQGLQKSLLNDKEEYEKTFNEEYTYKTMTNIPLIIIVPNKKVHNNISKVCGQIDIAPTILNLCGIENTLTNSLGCDILSKSKENYVTGLAYTHEGSYANDEFMVIVDNPNTIDGSQVIDMKTNEIYKYDNFDDTTKGIMKSNYEKSLHLISYSNGVIKGN